MTHDPDTAPDATPEWVNHAEEAVAREVYRSPFREPGHAGPHLPLRTGATASSPPDPDRPRYRVLAAPYYVDDPVDGSPQLVGYELTVARVDLSDRPGAPLGVARVPATVAGRLDPAVARAAVVDWLRLRAAPRVIAATSVDVELYLRLPDAPPPTAQDRS